MARGNPASIALGPGYLYAGPIGTTEPTDLVTAWSVVSAAWLPLGYTETGSEFGYALATGTVLVAEELDPIAIATTGRTATVTFNLSQITIANLKLAMNGGVINTVGATTTIEPPDLGTEVRTMLGWEAEDHSERWIYRQCLQSGTAKITRQKGNTNATIATTFSLEKPASGSRLFKAILQTSLRLT
jgi:hypothetical protein